MGSSMAEATPQLLQLFVLGIDMMKEPLNIQSMISWLYSPMQPFGHFFGSILAETIIAEGGYRNSKCQKIVADYISGKYTYHDKDEESKLSEKEIVKRNQKEEKERTVLVKTYLPSFEATGKDAISVMKLKVYLNSLSGWARNHVHFLREKPGNEGWCSQLESLAQMCETFMFLLDYSEVKDAIDVKQVDSWISTLYKGESFIQYAPQKGSMELIDSPAKMASHSKRTVWMNFSGGDSKHLDCSFLYPSEREKMKQHITMWNESEENYYNELMQLMPFLLTDDQLILVVTDYQDGEVSPKHPILVRLESQIENLSDFIIHPNLNEEHSDSVKLVRNNNTLSLIPFDHADLLKWPGYLSPTSLRTLVEYPIDYLMERMLNIVSTGPGSIKELKTTKGTVAHAVIEALFSPRDGHSCSKADEIEQRIEEEFDMQVARQIDACGAILYLPENRLDAELLKELLRNCLDVLLNIIRDITDQMEEVFVTRFHEIDACFRETFLELFGGGKAALKLEDENDVLGCGIEIKVQPPGKALSNISLLSGGEMAFVAIALYFAILKVRPTPFCVMDEIEAALDEANVNRYASYMRRMADKTQFLVITHRRGTMEEADMLYGVTMQEKGVSTVIELDLDQAQKTIEE